MPPKFEFLKLELAAETLAASVAESLVAGRASRPVTALKFPSFPTSRFCRFCRRGWELGGWYSAFLEIFKIFFGLKVTFPGVVRHSTEVLGSSWLFFLTNMSHLMNITQVFTRFMKLEKPP